MLIKNRILGVCFGIFGLSSCTMNPPDGYSDYYSIMNQSTPLYPESYNSDETYIVEQEPSKNKVVVPETYHVSTLQPPVSSRDVDRNWIYSQDGQGYTIEIADSDKPSQVSNMMSKAPKKEQMAEVKYHRDGKTYYRGLYGTYPSYETAEQALNTLPVDVKQGAGIKKWENVRNSINE